MSRSSYILIFRTTTRAVKASSPHGSAHHLLKPQLPPRKLHKATTSSRVSGPPPSTLFPPSSQLDPSGNASKVVTNRYSERATAVPSELPFRNESRSWYTANWAKNGTLAGEFGIKKDSGLTGAFALGILANVKTEGKAVGVVLRSWSLATCHPWVDRLALRNEYTASDLHKKNRRLAKKLTAGQRLLAPSDSDANGDGDTPRKCDFERPDDIAFEAATEKYEPWLKRRHLLPPTTSPRASGTRWDGFLTTR
ncbi:hypothetical protein BV22DRAFT_1128797 [Leucogyrophana mollusca]|uniref:Uncharacterized protein n=1 Tax=Leucogyrophana mollusca TaxID=85980 RepID=A0ACB8BKK0_9AGAM|nr:hypothetical protein BV22DRAFT_1128797 [Leucogyrophana mollusca]